MAIEFRSDIQRFSPKFKIKLDTAFAFSRILNRLKIKNINLTTMELFPTWADFYWK